MSRTEIVLQVSLAVFTIAATIWAALRGRQAELVWSDYRDLVSAATARANQIRVGSERSFLSRSFDVELHGQTHTLTGIDAAELLLQSQPGIVLVSGCSGSGRGLLSSQLAAALMRGRDVAIETVSLSAYAGPLEEWLGREVERRWSYSAASAVTDIRNGKLLFIFEDFDGLDEARRASVARSLNELAVNTGPHLLLVNDGDHKRLNSDCRIKVEGLDGHETLQLLERIDANRASEWDRLRLRSESCALGHEWIFESPRWLRWAVDSLDPASERMRTASAVELRTEMAEAATLSVFDGEEFRRRGIGSSWFRTLALLSRSRADFSADTLRVDLSGVLVTPTRRLFVYLIRVVGMVALASSFLSGSSAITSVVLFVFAADVMMWALSATGLGGRIPFSALALCLAAIPATRSVGASLGTSVVLALFGFLVLRHRAASAGRYELLSDNALMVVAIASLSSPAPAPLEIGILMVALSFVEGAHSFIGVSVAEAARWPSRLGATKWRVEAAVSVVVAVGVVSYLRWRGVAVAHAYVAGWLATLVFALRRPRALAVLAVAQEAWLPVRLHQFLERSSSPEHRVLLKSGSTTYRFVSGGFAEYLGGEGSLLGPSAPSLPDSA